MPDLPATEMGLEQLRVDTYNARQQALKAHDQDKADSLKKLLDNIDDALDDLAAGQYAGLGARLAECRQRLEALTRQATAWPFGASAAPTDHERPLHGDIADNDFADPGPDQPAPPPATPPADAVPAVSPGWAENYAELWRTMQILPQWQKPADAIASKIVANQGRYAAAVAGTAVPWWFIAVVHAMECSLRFDEHLHNGDTLTARTVHVPSGRPPVGSPPFTWEESARDSIGYEKLDKVADWSLTSVLFHWHRYNGINNQYKARGIPTPYLWSGSQHYTKGKYVADGQFDPNAVSAQVGAAVVLRALIGLGAVKLDADMAITANPAAATGHTASLDISLPGAAFRHVADELDYPGPLHNGSGRTAAERRQVKRVQEWLNIHDCVTAIDGGFGDSTEEQLRKFQAQAQRQPTGQLDEEIWALLTAPMRRALAGINHGASAGIEEAVVAVAEQHIRERPVEVGGGNRGPWVRLYMQGKEGTDQKWCAGFACLMVAQAARDLAVGIPFRRQVGVDQLVADAREAGRFIGENELPGPLQRRSKLRPGYLFVVRAAATDWIHTGIVLAIKDTTFDTLEGNTGGDGGTDGPNARQANRPFTGKDFVRLL